MFISGPWSVAELYAGGILMFGGRENTNKIFDYYNLSFVGYHGKDVQSFGSQRFTDADYD